MSSTSMSRATYDDDDWRDAAACIDMPADVFFPIGETGEAVPRIARAKEVCAQCPVKEACLDFALLTNQEFGVWGGLDEEERRQIRRRLRRQRGRDHLVA